jgi:hypothetical protein
MKIIPPENWCTNLPSYDDCTDHQIETPIKQLVEGYKVFHYNVCYSTV